MRLCWVINGIIILSFFDFMHCRKLIILSEPSTRNPLVAGKLRVTLGKKDSTTGSWAIFRNASNLCVCKMQLLDFQKLACQCDSLTIKWIWNWTVGVDIFHFVVNEGRRNKYPWNLPNFFRDFSESFITLTVLSTTPMVTAPSNL